MTQWPPTGPLHSLLPLQLVLSTAPFRILAHNVFLVQNSISFQTNTNFFTEADNDLPQAPGTSLLATLPFPHLTVLPLGFLLTGHPLLRT